MKKIFILLHLLLLLISQQSYAQENNKDSAKPFVMGQELREAQFYFLTDPDTGEVLLAKNPDTRIPPSSMTKVMTAYVVFDQLQKGSISVNNQCLIGKDAWRKSGSTMFLNYGDIVSMSISQLSLHSIQTIVDQSSLTHQDQNLAHTNKPI